MNSVNGCIADWIYTNIDMEQTDERTLKLANILSINLRYSVLEDNDLTRKILDLLANGLRKGMIDYDLAAQAHATLITNEVFKKPNLTEESWIDSKHYPAMRINYFALQILFPGERTYQLKADQLTILKDFAYEGCLRAINGTDDKLFSNYLQIFNSAEIAGCKPLIECLVKTICTLLSNKELTKTLGVKAKDIALFLQALDTHKARSEKLDALIVKAYLNLATGFPNDKPGWRGIDEVKVSIRPHCLFMIKREKNELLKGILLEGIQKIDIYDDTDVLLVLQGFNLLQDVLKMITCIKPRDLSFERTSYLVDNSKGHIRHNACDSELSISFPKSSPTAPKGGAVSAKRKTKKSP